MAPNHARAVEFQRPSVTAQIKGVDAKATFGKLCEKIFVAVDVLAQAVHKVQDGTELTALLGKGKAHCGHQDPPTGQLFM